MLVLSGRKRASVNSVIGRASLFIIYEVFGDVFNFLKCSASDGIMRVKFGQVSTAACCGFFFC